MDEEFIKTMLKLHTFSALDTFGNDVVVVLNEGEPGDYENNPTIKKFEGIGYRLCDANMFGKGLERYQTLSFCKRKDKENQAGAYAGESDGERRVAEKNRKGMIFSANSRKCPCIFSDCIFAA